MAATNGSLASTTTSRPLTPGIYAPIPTFFLAGSEELDIPSLQKHIVNVASTGVGILVCGSMGEAHHLSDEERLLVIKSARSALDEAGYTTVPIVAGTGLGSTKETIKLTIEAAKAGADYSIVIPSGYFAGAIANDRAGLKRFFKEIAEASPIPVIVYNYPGAAGGIDMDSDLIEEMATDIPNLCGVKLTCGNVGKLTRIAGVVSSPSFAEKHPRKNKDAPFLVLGGFTDFLLPSLYANAHGAITGLANLYPRSIQHLWLTSVSSLPSAGSTPQQLAQNLQEAQRLQNIIAHADRTLAVSGIAGTKWLMQRRYGFGGVPRLPMSALQDSTGEKLLVHPHVQEIEALEQSLEKAQGGKTPKATATNGVTTKGLKVTNGTLVSKDLPTLPTPTSASSATSITEKPTPVSPTKDKSHSRAGSLSNGIRSIIGSMRKNRNSVVIS